MAWNHKTNNAAMVQPTNNTNVNNIPTTATAKQRTSNTPMSGTNQHQRYVQMRNEPTMPNATANNGNNNTCNNGRTVMFFHTNNNRNNSIREQLTKQQPYTTSSTGHVYTTAISNNQCITIHVIHITINKVTNNVIAQRRNVVNKQQSIQQSTGQNNNPINNTNHVTQSTTITLTINK